MSEKENTTVGGGSKDELSLSAALLAPLNSIFEAQIHSARAFLNFILQMGFRHHYTKEETEQLEKLKKNFPPEFTQEDRKDVNDALAWIKKKEEADKNIKPILDKAAEPDTALSEKENEQVANYMREYGDLHQQCISYVDGNGKPRKIFIPNLALLPVQPMNIENAKFTYEMYVAEESKTFDQMGTVKGLATVKRPWYLINPKSIRGSITSENASSSSKTIKIEMNVKSGNMPYGLHKLLVALTNVAEVTDDKSNPKQ